MIFDGIEKVPAADSKPLIYNGKIYVPLSYITKSIGKNFEWDAKNKTAYIGYAKKEVSKEVTAKTSDNYAQLTFPSGWTKDTDRQNVALSYSNSINNNSKSIVVVRDDKSYFAENATVNDYCNLAIKSISNRLENVATTEPVQININNFPGLQLNLQGEIQKVKIQYLITIIETNDSFYQLIGYTYQNIYDKCKSDFIKIINTFKEVPK